MSDNTTEWHPPQEKYIRWGINAAIIAALVFGGSVIVKKIVPTISDAFLLLQTLTENMIYLALTVGAAVVVGWLLLETLTPKGRINKLFAQAYSSFIRAMTMELLNVDPITPLTDSLANVRERKKDYDEQFARFDGQIQILVEQEEKFRASSTKAETQAKAANSQGNVEARDRAAYKAGSDKEVADNFAKMRSKLVPIRQVIVKLQGAAGDIIYKLEIDIESTKAQWEQAKNLSKMERAARGIMEGAGKNELAKEAQALVQSKYAASIGRLNNLNDAAQPLLESIDLDKATYSQELLDKWSAEEHAATMIAIPMQASIVAPLAIPAPGAKTAASGGFSGLIDN